MKLPKYLFLVFLMVIFLFFYCQRLFSLPVFQIPTGKQYKIIGRVSSPPLISGSTQLVKIGPARLILNRFHKIYYGDMLEAVGIFNKRVINQYYYNYYSYYPSILKINKYDNRSPIFFSLKAFLGRANLFFMDTINQTLPEPQSSLMGGVLLGAKSNFSHYLQNIMRETGTIHVAVASGQNVIFVTSFIWASLSYLIRRKYALFLAAIGTVLYVLAVGADPPVVRAGLMALILFLSQWLGREYLLSYSLLITIILMLLISPLILFDLSFQLSVAATLGIYWFYPLLKKIKVFQINNFIVEALVTTISAQVLVWPIVAYHFGTLNLISPIVNALVLWTVPIVMILGLPLVILGLASVGLAQVFAWLAWPFLTIFILVVEYFSQYSWLSLKIDFLSNGLLLVYYFLAILIIWKKGQQSCAKWK